MADAKDLLIIQGKTFTLPIRWGSTPIIYRPITAISQTAPVRLTVPAHGLPDGWSVAVTNVKGMTEINSVANNIKAKDYVQATVIDANTLELNDINAGGFKPYVSGGYVQYNCPVSLVGFTARMEIKNKVGGTVLASTKASDSPLNVITATIDTARFTITLNIPASATAAFTWASGVYDLELVSPDSTPVVTAILTGKVSVTKEVTT